jgi:hypothetical protein
VGLTAIYGLALYGDISISGITSLLRRRNTFFRRAIWLTYKNFLKKPSDVVVVQTLTGHTLFVGGSNVRLLNGSIVNKKNFDLFEFSQLYINSKVVETI